jgi:hypothetical protein
VIRMEDSLKTSSRTQVLHSLGAGGAELEELLMYGQNHFQNGSPGRFDEGGDEAFVEAWRGYHQEVKEAGRLDVLAQKLPQLRFPIEEGMSRTDAYRAATLRGSMLSSPSAADLGLSAPSECTVEIYATPCGHMPVIKAKVRADFERLVQAFTNRNEPKPVARSMGACMIAGYNNWDRIAALRTQHALAGSTEPWATTFLRIKQDKALYQDRFILLSCEPYSAVSAADLGISPARWIVHSTSIRLEHECIHYATLRLFGKMRNALFDELIADYFGIRASLGFFRADWLLRFWGLESFPAYRPGGRLENYRGEPLLSDGAFEVLKRLAVAAADNLEKFDRTCVKTKNQPLSARGKRELLAAIASLSVEEIAHDDGVAFLAQALHKAQSTGVESCDSAAATMPC